MSPELERLIEQSREIAARMTPEEHARMVAEQTRSWVRGETALAVRVKKHVEPDGSIIYEDYCSYCFD